MPFRPETRPDPPTDADVHRLATYPGVVGRIAQAAELQRDMERETPCQSVRGCDRPADWLGRSHCPKCRSHMFRAGAAVFLCDPHRTRWLARLAGMAVPICPHCGATSILPEIHAAMTWTALR